jgi:ankyrin repeat protein
MEQVIGEGDAASLQVLLDYGCDTTIGQSSKSTFVSSLLCCYPTVVPPATLIAATTTTATPVSVLHYCCQQGNIDCLRLVLNATNNNRYNNNNNLNLAVGPQNSTPLHVLILAWQEHEQHHHSYYHPTYPSQYAFDKYDRGGGGSSSMTLSMEETTATTIATPTPTTTATKLLPSSTTRHHQYAECLQLLLQQPDIDPIRQDSLGRNVLYLACVKGLVPAVLLLLLSSQSHGGATTQKDRTRMKRNTNKVRQHFLPLQCRPRHYNILHAAVDSMSPEVVQLLYENHLASMSLPSKSSLINRGRRLRFQTTNVLHVQDEYGNTPLHLACRPNQNIREQQRIVEYLLQSGADPNGRNDDGDTPLLLAVRNWRTERYGVVKFLLDHGGDCTMSEWKKTKKNSGKWSPGNAITREKLLVEVVLRHGSAIDQRQLIPRTQLRTTVSMAQQSHGWTPLHYAAFYGDVELVQLLLDRGANANVKDGRGRTPLFVTHGLCLETHMRRTTITGGLDMAARLVQSSDPLPMEGEDLSIANNFRVLTNKNKGEETVSSLLIRHGMNKALFETDADGNLPFGVACAVSDGSSGNNLTTIFQIVRAMSRTGLIIGQMSRSSAIPPVHVIDNLNC